MGKGHQQQFWKVRTRRGEGWQTARGKYFMVSFEGTWAEGWVGDSAGAAHSLDGSVGAWGVEGLRVPRTNQ